MGWVEMSLVAAPVQAAVFLHPCSAPCPFGHPRQCRAQVGRKAPVLLWNGLCGEMSMLGTAAAEAATEKEINGQAPALTHCMQGEFSFGGAVIRIIYVTASKQG